MSLPLKSELRLRVGPQHCEAAILPAGPLRRPAGRARSNGPGDQSVALALDALAAQGHTLPAQAVLCVEDEFAYYAALPAERSQRQAQRAAQDYFASMLGSEQLLVDTTLAPCGSRWIAVAVDAGQVAGWQQLLDDRGIQVRALHVALLEDLWRLRRSVAFDDGLIALVRAEGASVVEVRAGGVADIAWERCDVQDSEELAARILARAEDLGDALDGSVPGVCVVPSHAGQVAPLREQTDRHGWQLTPCLSDLVA